MAEIYQVPDGNNGLPFTIPIGGNGGLFGNGNNSLADLFGFAIIASMFGWNNGNGFGGFGGNGNFGGAGFISNQLNNDSGRELIMNAVTSQGEAQRTAIQTLASTIGQDFNLVNGAIMNIQNALNTIASNQGMNALQVINAIQSGNASLASQFANCCCQNQMSMMQQTTAINENGTRNTQSILAKLDAMQTQALQDKLDAARAENTRLSGEISQAQQNNVIAGMIANAVNPIATQLAGIRSEVDAIKRCQPETITIADNSKTVVPTIWANGVADLVVDRIASALAPTTTPTAA